MASDKRAARLGLLAAVAVMLFSGLGARLWFLQTVESTSLQQVVDQRNTRTVLLPPERGQIFDHDGRLLAGNEPVYNVAVDWAALSRSADRAALFSRLSGWVRVPVEEMEERYDSGDFSTLRPLPIAEDVSEDVVIAIGERREDFPGVRTETSYRRVYPYAPLAAHVVGYMGAITEEDQAHYDNLGYDTSNRGEDVGRAGVELEYETTLHGRWGQIVYEVDSHGTIVREISRRDPVDGRDLQLSIDLDLQQYAERLLQTQLRLRRAFTAPNPIVDKPDGTRQRMSLNHGPLVYYKAPAGSVVVMNHQTGQVMAMASYPTFDNRWFSQDVSGEKFRELFEIRQDTPDCGDEGQPQCPLDPDRSSLANRAIQGQYNMGSAFKPFVAWSALHTGLESAESWINDQGIYKAETIEDDVCASGIKCVWRNAFCSSINGPCRYGSINMFWSLAVSSDVYYYRLGEMFSTTPNTNRELLQNELRNFGFASETGIDLPYEFDGRLPDHETKKALVEAEVLHPTEEPRVLLGDVINLSIGQGLLAATPMQMAVGYGAFANGGYALQPRVVEAIYEPGTRAHPTQPGFVDLSTARLHERLAPAVTGEIPMDFAEPVIDGIRQNVIGPGINGRSTTAEELFDVGWSEPANPPIAGKTGTAQGQYSYPWNDNSVFAAFSQDSARPWTVVSYLEKSGFGSLGSAPVVKCMLMALSGVTPLDPVAISEPLDPDSDMAAEPLPPLYDTSCMDSSIAHTVYPGPVLIGRPDD
jgi:penicillin-binding protein 2